MPCVALLGLSLAGRAAAQAPAVNAGVGAIGLLTSADPMPFQRTITEARVVQPLLMVDASWRGLAFAGMADLEGATIPKGQITPGAWGEGFIDRRHPHTWAHELIVSWTGAMRGYRLSLSGGKGFAPFGSDDPMNRPVMLYPVNHHLSQVLERAVLTAGIATRVGALEVGTFNGDEPTSPTSWPDLKRFGDSWSARLLLWPTPDVELQVSHAEVLSPENREPAAGPANHKWNASARFERAVDGRRHWYGLVEWSRTRELFTYQTLLAEAEFRHARHRTYLRLERTERPEEERLADPFRTSRPAVENSNLGTSRWLVATAGFGYTISSGRVSVEPVIEPAVAHVTMVGGGGVFTPASWYGRDNLVSLTLGVRMAAGMGAHRMGRYGVLVSPHAAMPMMPGMDMPMERP